MSTFRRHKQQIKAKLPFRDYFREIYSDHYRETGNSLCPFHDDHNESFQVEEDYGYCHAGCRPDNNSRGYDIFSLYQAHNECDFETAFNDLAKRAGVKIDGNGRKSRRRIVGTYDYVDENGKRLFQVVRYEPKDFRQRRTEPGGGWIWNMKDTRRVLYRLPQLAKCREVVFVEGEKDADSLIEMGVAATTACHIKPSN